MHTLFRTHNWDIVNIMHLWKIQVALKSTLISGQKLLISRLTWNQGYISQVALKIKVVFKMCHIPPFISTGIIRKSAESSKLKLLQSVASEYLVKHLIEILLPEAYQLKDQFSSLSTLSQFFFWVHCIMFNLSLTILAQLIKAEHQVASM